MGRVADERDPFSHHRARQVHLQRPQTARPCELDGAQSKAEAPLRFRCEARVVEGDDFPAPLFVLGPGDARAVAHQGQDGKRSGGEKVLHRARSMRLLVLYRRDDADLRIFPADELDAGSFPQA